MDRRLRELERIVQQDPGDIAARKNLENLRIHNGLCSQHGLHSKGYDPLTKRPDPAGWGTGCPACEEALFCVSGVCGMKSCHNCNPDFDCEYGHDRCMAQYDTLLQHGQDTWEEHETPTLLDSALMDDPIDTGEYDCGDCRGTGEGYPPGTNCSSCGGSGIPRRPRNWGRDPGSYPDSEERFYDEDPWDGPY